MQTTVNGITIAYDDHGPADAPAVMFIHGFPLNRSMWHAQMSALEGRCRVIAYDLRGHGDSERGDLPFSTALFVQDLLALMNALRIKKAALCALSMGGYIALKAAVEYPDRFTGLALCDTQCTADTEEAKQKRLDAIRAIGENGVEAFADTMLKALFLPESFETKRPEVGLVRSMISGTAQQTLEQSLLAMRERGETCSFLANIAVPTIIIVGKEDKITPPSAAVYMHERIAGSQIFVVENAGHLSNLEQPERFNEALKTLLTLVQCDSDR